MIPTQRLDDHAPWWRDHLAQLVIGMLLAIVTPVAAIVVTRTLASPPGNADAGHGAPPSSGQTSGGLVTLASVTSSSAPRPGQQHRSSGNFSTEEAPAGTTRLLWRITGTNGKVVAFDIMEDKSLRFDPVVFDNLTDGSTTKFYTSRSLYVANPRGSGDQSFRVTVYAVTKG